MVHRLSAVTAIGAGLIVLHASLTDQFTAHWPAVLIWIAASLATVAAYRRMRALAHDINKETDR